MLIKNTQKNANSAAWDLYPSYGRVTTKRVYISVHYNILATLFKYALLRFIGVGIYCCFIPYCIVFTASTIPDTRQYPRGPTGKMVFLGKNRITKASRTARSLFGYIMLTFLS